MLVFMEEEVGTKLSNLSNMRVRIEARLRHNHQVSKAQPTHWCKTTNTRTSWCKVFSDLYTTINYISNITGRHNTRVQKHTGKD